MLKNLLIALMWIPLHLYGETTQRPDTLILLEPTEVVAPRYAPFSAGHNIFRISDHLVDHHYDRGMGDVLSMHTGMFIRSYGPGMLASGSLRGASPAQTAIIWNGFSLQSPMHGQTDMAMLPVFFVDELGIQYGSGSALWGNGGMGGAVHVNNLRPEQQGFHLSGAISTVDYGDLAQHVDASWGNETLFTRLRVLNRNSENQYSFRNMALNSNPLTKQEHAALSNRALLHETYLNIGSRHRLDILFWWQESDRDIPAPVHFDFGAASQQDDAVRVTGQWQTFFNRSILSWRGGYFDESILYSDSFFGESFSRSKTTVQEADLLVEPVSGLFINTGVNTQWVSARADDYNGERYSQNTFALFSAVRWEAIPEKLQLTASGRQEFMQDQDIPFVPSFGASYRATEQWTIKGNVGKNFRLPTLNDKYWTPGGNPDLEPEYGWSQDIAFVYRHQQTDTNNNSSFVRLSGASLTGYHRNTTQWIIWAPVDDTMFWSPQNLQEVQSYGTEFRLMAEAGIRDFSFHLEGRWDHNIAENTKAVNAEDDLVGRQLIYVPLNSLGYHLLIGYHRFSLFVNHQYTGKRYTAGDNSRWLSSFSTLDAGLQWQHHLEGYHYRVFVSASNILNEQYEILEGRPMPLRYFRAGLQVGLFAGK